MRIRPAHREGLARLPYNAGITMTADKTLSHRHASDIPDRIPYLARTFIARVGEWRRRSQSRRALLALDERDLWDLRLSRGDAEQEAYKPFWRE
jgi:uncharacterized protein YjiS (DUF1127 family)